MPGGDVLQGKTSAEIPELSMLLVGKYLQSRNPPKGESEHGHCRALCSSQ